LIAAGEPAFAAHLAAIESLAAALQAIGGAPPPAPRWNQDWFPRLDAAAAYAMVRRHRPARIVEVGSGHSTRFLARAVVDCSGRPFAVVDLQLTRERLGDLACENIGHVVQSLAVASRSCIHLDVLRGSNNHHKAEAAYKALALALRAAVARDGGDEVPSTKGVL